VAGEGIAVNGGETSGEISAYGGDEIILLVDDEEPIRELYGEFLRQYGYQVVTANTGESGLEIYNRENQNIDLVIMDINMPGKGGLWALNQMMTVDPDLKAIIISGYSDIEIQGAYRDFGAKSCLSKPFRTWALLSEIRTVLEE
jgi:DNA-binding NtrC family response regulator